MRKEMERMFRDHLEERPFETRLELVREAYWKVISRAKESPYQ
jgi:hypothetical protein